MGVLVARVVRAFQHLHAHRWRLVARARAERTAGSPQLVQRGRVVLPLELREGLQHVVDRSGELGIGFFVDAAEEAEQGDDRRLADAVIAQQGRVEPIRVVKPAEKIHAVRPEALKATLELFLQVLQVLAFLVLGRRVVWHRRRLIRAIELDHRRKERAILRQPQRRDAGGVDLAGIDHEHEVLRALRARPHPHRPFEEIIGGLQRLECHAGLE
eukprot:4466398-Prymnesium_polylepis.1